MEKLRKIVQIGFVVAILLLPMVGRAGDLEPSGPPASTMKTLDQIPPTWSQKLPAAQRFELVLDDAAVLDKETGLVWEKSPSISTYHAWTEAMCVCGILEVGGRKGWHLPTIEQLASLIDTSVSGSPKLPNGHPFTNVQSGDRIALRRGHTPLPSMQRIPVRHPCKANLTLSLTLEMCPHPVSWQIRSSRQCSV